MAEKVTQDHYFSAKPKTERVVETSFRYTIRDVACYFDTASGMFSVEHVDIGSAVLIKYAHVEPHWDILDLACGWGAVGIFLKKFEPSITVTFTDVNERAVSYTKKNIVKNNIPPKDTKVFSGEFFTKIKPEKKFDAIYLNPPHSAGKKICLEMIKQAKDYLKVGGNLQIVARKNKGGAPLAAFMEEHFGNIKVLKKKSGFWVWESVLE